MDVRVLTALIGTALILAACHGAVSQCTRGHQVECACPDGLRSIQRCNAESYYDDCECGSLATGSGGSSATTTGTGGAPSTTSSAAGGEGTAGGMTGGGGAGGGTMSTGEELTAGPESLIDMFVGPNGIYVVLLDRVLLLDHSGNAQATWLSERDITAAAFDGTHLGVADTAVLNMFDASLTPTVTANLVQTCASAVMVSGPRFICGPSNDWQRIFDTFDATTGALLASSLDYTYNGIPMRLVPGTDEFVTVTTALSPSDFHLYETLPTGAAFYINESPYHGDFPVTDVYAFLGDPATHLVTRSGLILLLHGPNCTPNVSSFNSECFLQDGVLGTLTGSQFYIAMEGHADGHILALVDLMNGPWVRCESGCLVQAIDSTTKTITSQVPLVQELAGGPIVLHHDPATELEILAYEVPDPGSPTNPPLGHRVVAIGL